LRVMRERSERIGAQFHVWSRGERGTKVEMSIPGRIAFRCPRKGGSVPGIVNSLRRGVIPILGGAVWPRVNTEKVVHKDSEQR
jgi:hypothetical protein